MLCILFIATRMRALSLGKEPQAHAKNAMFLCAYAMAIQTLVVIVAPYIFGGTIRKGMCQGDIQFHAKDPKWFTILTMFRWLAMIVLYIGMVIVIVSTFTISSTDISPAMKCLLNLLTSFFFVYLGLWISVLWNQFVGSCARAIKVFDIAKNTVLLNPMLAILFIGARMRALQITKQEGAPQGYAQQ